MPSKWLPRLSVDGTPTGNNRLLPICWASKISRVMIKLYKNGVPNLYWEAWSSPTEVTIHWGVLGQEGETREIPLAPGDDVTKILEREARRPKEDGFKEIAPSRLQRLVIQYQVEGMGRTTDLHKRTRVEGAMNECLGWRGLGHCDGGEIGSGTMNVFCFVVNVKTAIPHVLEELRKNELLEGAVVAVGDPQTVVWPRDFSGTFEI